MGNEGSVLKPHTLLTQTDLGHLRQTFPDSPGAHLWHPWTDVFDKNTIRLLEKELLDTSGKISFQKYQQMAGDLVKGGIDAKIDFVCKIARTPGQAEDTNSIKRALKVFITAYSHCQPKKGILENSDSDCEILAKSLLHDVEFPSEKRKASFTKDSENRLLDRDEIEKWFPPLLESIIKCVMIHCFNIPTTVSNQLIPNLPGAEKTSLTFQQVLFLNSALPHEHRATWRPLFNTQFDGESFSKLSGSILNQGPNIIVIWDKAGNVFGGFAAVGWKLGPKFCGKPECFLFHLSPKMNIYETTPFNTNYQYFNLKQKTLPNGLGMGGQLEYFGLWLDSEFGIVKTSPTCSTFHSAQLGELEGGFQRLEVWGVGELKEDEDEGGRSVLDMDPEAQAVMEMMGKTFHSKVIREVDSKEDDGGE